MSDQRISGPDEEMVNGGINGESWGLEDVFLLFEFFRLSIREAKGFDEFCDVAVQNVFVYSSSL